jgi:hypothetical protein
LRFDPDNDLIAPDARTSAGGKSGKSSDGETDGVATPTTGPSTRPQHSHATTATAQPASAGANIAWTRGRVWVRDADSRYVRPIRVKVGPTDDSFTMVESKDLKDGMELVTGTARTEAATSGASSGGASPFVPQMPKRH